MSFNISDVDNLEKGHVFEREDGRMSRVLFVTNTSLSSKTQKKFPPQVVYADEQGNILSCDIARFLSTRKFYNVDPGLEQRLNDLLISDEQLQEDELDLDSDRLIVLGDEEDEGEDESSMDSALAAMAQSNATSTDVSEQPASEDLEDLDTPPCVTFIPSTLDLPLVFNPSELARSVSSYQQTPDLASNKIQHSLYITADEGVTQERLFATFSPSHEDINAIFTFSVNLKGTEMPVDWDSFAGIYPCVFYGVLTYQAIFVTQANVQPAAEEPKVIHTEVQIAVSEASAAPVADQDVLIQPAAVAAETQPQAVVVQPAVQAQPVTIQVQPSVAAQ